MTSFGTRMWYPISTQARRVGPAVHHRFQFHGDYFGAASDRVDLSRSPEKSHARAVRMWVLFTVGDALAWLLTRAAGYPFHLWVALLASLLLAALFFAPVKGGWGFRVTRAQWCQAGSFAALVYLLRLLAGASRGDPAREGVRGSEPHRDRVALARCRFRRPGSIGATRFGRLTDYSNRSSICARPGPLDFQFIPDSPPDRIYRTRLRAPQREALLEVRALPFDPQLRRGQGIRGRAGRKSLFRMADRRSPQPFTYRVVFDDAGNVIEQGWLTNGMLQMPHETNGAAAARAATTARNLREGLDLQRYSRRSSRARRGSSRSRRIVYIAAGDLATFGKGLDRCGESAEAARRAAVGAAGKSRDARRHSRALCERFGFVDFHRPAVLQTTVECLGRDSATATSLLSTRPANIPRKKSRRRSSAFDGIHPALSRGSFPAVTARELDEYAPGKHAGSPALRAWVEARAAAVSFLRPHPRDRRPLRPARNHAVHQRRKEGYRGGSLEGTRHLAVTSSLQDKSPAAGGRLILRSSCARPARR